MLVLVAFLSMSVFTLVVDKGWLDESIATQINFIPMVSVIVAYVGYGLGYGVIPSLIAAETMPVDVRSTAVGLFMTVNRPRKLFDGAQAWKLPQQNMSKLSHFQNYVSISGGDVVHLPALKTETNTDGQSPDSRIVRNVFL